MFSFGNVLADLAGTGDEACCIHAQLKFTNATKVPSTVHLSVTPDNNDNSSSPYPLSVVPKSVEIAPHEYQFITVTFHPGQIIPYSATFQAKVENGEGRPDTETFICSMQVRPCVKMTPCETLQSDRVWRQFFHNCMSLHRLAP